MRKLLLVFLIFSLSSCGNNDIKISAVRKSFKKSYGNCDTGRCMEFSVVYDSIVSENAEAGRINEFIKNKILEDFPDDENPDNFDELYKLLKKEYLEFINDIPDVFISWRYNFEVALECFCQPVISIKYDKYEYTGGAHGNETVVYYNFKFVNGKPELIDNPFNPRETEMIIAWIKNELRKKFKLKENEPLENAGLWESFDSSYRFNNNFKITKKGLSIIFNQYEIAPYSMGIIEVEIPYEKLPGSVYEKFFN